MLRYKLSKLYLCLVANASCGFVCFFALFVFFFVPSGSAALPCSLLPSLLPCHLIGPCWVLPLRFSCPRFRVQSSSLSLSVSRAVSLSFFGALPSRCLLSVVRDFNLNIWLTDLSGIRRCMRQRWAQRATASHWTAPGPEGREKERQTAEIDREKLP